MEIPPPDTDKSAENEYLITPEASIQSALLIHFNRENQSLKKISLNFTLVSTLQRHCHLRNIYWNPNLQIWLISLKYQFEV
jgi:hypothetical protein